MRDCRQVKSEFYLLLGKENDDQWIKEQVEEVEKKVTIKYNYLKNLISIFFLFALQLQKKKRTVS